MATDDAICASSFCSILDSEMPDSSLTKRLLKTCNDKLEMPNRSQYYNIARHLI